jgi:hypothetical protein
MKIETNKKSGFEPIELKITIESLAELKMMALRMNAPTYTLEEYDGVELSEKEMIDSNNARSELFSFFDKKLIELRISADL